MFMTKETQCRFVVLLSAYVNQNNCTKKAVLDYIDRMHWLNLTECDLQIIPAIGELKWRNQLAFTRKHLVMEGYLSKERKDWWKITESGIQQLSALLEELKISEHPLIAESAIKDAEIKNIEILLPAAVSHIRSSVDKLQITKTEREAIIQQRIGQGIFRERLLTRSHTCQVCGLENKSLLRASHIKPWSKSDNIERLDPNNGLLLCSIHDALFDKGLISFSPEGKIMISSLLSQQDYHLLHLSDSITVHDFDTTSNYFDYHRESVFQE